MSDVHPEAEARMVDVTAKEVTARTATAEATVAMTPESRALIEGRGLPKGDALEVARIAGIQAAKRTADLIPLCHPIGLGAVAVDLESVPEGIRITATVKTRDRTGVEMEALTAASVAALTIYDMIKGSEATAEIMGVRLLSKAGGKSGEWRREADAGG